MFSGLVNEESEVGDDGDDGFEEGMDTEFDEGTVLYGWFLFVSAFCFVLILVLVSIQILDWSICICHSGGCSVNERRLHLPRNSFSN